MDRSDTTYFFAWNDHEVPAPVQGVRSYMKGGEHLTLALYELAPNVSVPEHVHESDEAGFVAEGEIEVMVGDERRVVRAGDGFIIPKGARHAARTLAVACRLIECYAPPR